jgi:hypothetical protein
VTAARETTQDPEPGCPGFGAGVAGVRDEMGRAHADPLGGILSAVRELRRTGGGGARLGPARLPAPERRPLPTAVRVPEPGTALLGGPLTCRHSKWAGAAPHAPLVPYAHQVLGTPDGHPGYWPACVVLALTKGVARSFAPYKVERES